MVKRLHGENENERCVRRSNGLGLRESLISGWRITKEENN